MRSCFYGVRSMARKLFVVLCCLGLGSSLGVPLRGQGSGNLDPSFNVSFGSQGTVSSVVVQPDGKLVIAGAFGSIDGSPQQNIGRLNADGTLDESFVPINLNGSISKMFLQADGTIIVGGFFSSVNGTAQNGIARINPDGSLNPLLGANAPANAGSGPIALQPDGKVIIAMSSELGNGPEINNITRLNADGSLDSTFNAGNWQGSIVTVLFVQPDGKVLLGGSIQIASGGWAAVARLNADGSVDQTFNAPTSFVGVQYESLILQPDGKVIVSVDLFFDGPSISRGIVRLNADGSLDSSFEGSNGPADYVEAAALQSNGQIVVGGSLSIGQIQGQRQLARLNADGSLDTSFDAGPGGVTGTPYVDIQALAIQADGNIIVGGDFTFINGVGHASIARLLSSGGSDGSFVGGVENGGAIGIDSLAVQPDGKILVGGGFTTLNGVPMGCFARLNSDGSIDGSFIAGAGATTNQPLQEYVNGGPPGLPVEAILLDPDGTLTVSGYFSEFDDAPRTNIARVNGDGSLDDNFVGPASMTGLSASNINAIAFQGDGKVLIGGAFNDVDNVFVAPLMRLNVDGSVDSTFAPDVNRLANTSFFGPNAIVVQPDGRILVGGVFDQGGTYPGIARLNADGSLDATFNPGSGVVAYVDAIALQPDGKIIVAGGFGTLDAFTGYGIVRLNGDGSLDSSFNSGAGLQNGSVYCLALQPDGRVLAGGPFSSYSGVPRQSLVRLNADGGVDTRFDPGTELPADGVRALALQANGEILASGDTVMRLYGDPPRPAFFNGARNVDNDYFYLAFPNGTPFGFYSYNYYPYLYHRDLGFEYVMDAGDGQNGVYLYDFASQGFFYTNPNTFPCLYDFNLGAFIYYFAEPAQPGRYTSDPRVFVNLATGEFIFD